jgi:hypothetical protein
MQKISVTKLLPDIASGWGEFGWQAGSKNFTTKNLNVVQILL